MKIKTKTLSTFLKKARMAGTQKVDECIFHFEKDGLKISANSQPQQARTMAWLKNTAFVEYEEFGNIGLNDLDNVCKAIERFDDVITIKKEGNLLTISGTGKKVDIELVAENFLSTDTGEPKLEFTETFVIGASKLKDVYDDVRMNKDAYITVSTEEKKVKFSNTGKYKFLNDVDAPTCKGGTKVNFGSPLIDATSELTGNLEISVKTDYPAKITEKTEESVITLIVAPRMSDEE